LLRDSALWLERGQNSKTLLKLPDLRLVLIALKSGHQIQRHQTDLRLNLTTFAGHVQLTVGDQTIDLPAGHVLVLDPAIPHDVAALEDSVILLSLSSAA
jgi:quercetin dioxygenase-like cupin family protein